MFKIGLCGRIAALWGLLAVTAAAAASTDPSDRAIEFERLHVAYRVEQDGSFVETRTSAMKVLQEGVLEHAKDASVSYSASLQTFEVVEAYTRKPDGRRVDVPKSNYQVNTNAGHASGGPVFSDHATTTVVFPDLAVGDTLVLSYRLTARQPMFDGHFSTVETFAADQYYADVRVSFDAPEALPVRFQAWQMKPEKEVRRNGRRVNAWTYANRAPVQLKRSGAEVYEFGQTPGVVYSTFADYAAIANAYGARALPKAAVTPRIKALADEVAGARSEPRDVARALYEWVSTRITYAGNCIGLGAVVPHDLDFVLDNKMGDCKDHATLLQALLAARGIASEQVLINAGNVYRLPEVPVVSMVNHVLNYLPALDLYVDATAKGVPFGLLPYVDVDKPVLHVASAEVLRRTPKHRIGINGQRMDTVLRIQPDGSVQGKVTVDMQGMPALDARARFRELPASRQKDLVRDIFRGAGLSASGTLRADDAGPLLDTFSYDAQFDVAQMLPVPGAFAVMPVFYSESPIARFVASANGESGGEGDETCVSGRSRETYRYEFPKEMKVVMVPPDVQLSNDVLSYTARHELAGNVLTVVRELDDRTPGALCSPAFNRSYRELARQVLANLRAQVIYQPAAP